MPIQLHFTVRRLAELAHDDPSLQTLQPYKAAAEDDLHGLGVAMVKHYHGDDSDLKLLMAAVTAAFDTVSVGDYDAEVKAFFDATSHPTLKLPLQFHDDAEREFDYTAGAEWHWTSLGLRIGPW